MSGFEKTPIVWNADTCLYFITGAGFEPAYVPTYEAGVLPIHYPAMTEEGLEPSNEAL